jgi:hypothetical protein
MYARQKIAMVLLAFAGGFCFPLRSQIVAVEAGGLKGTKGEGQTYSWRIEYRQPFGDGWAAGLGWLNEGHLPDHHRDGQVFQLWKYWQPMKGRLLVGLGAGGYHFYDTTSNAAGEYQDNHGTRGIFSLSAIYAFGTAGRWVGLLEYNRTNGASDPQTQALLVGVGIRIGKPFHETVEAPSKEKLAVDQSLNLYVGKAIQNSFSSESDSGYQIEYRHNITTTWEWSAAYSNEGTLGTFQRDGAVAQIWYGDWFMDQRLKLAFGGGPYVANTWDVDPVTRQVSNATVRLNGRITVLVGFRTSRQVLVSAAWNRTATTDHRDTDLIVLGLGYGW